MIGKTILHYKIVDKLGEGGMGVVYKAKDTKLKREVAIKLLPRFISSNKEERQRFEIEAQAAASLNHPNIATIHSIEEVDDQLFIVMEYIDGRELKDRINSDPISTDEVINIANKIAEGLEAAHKKGIIHRDIKSSNIMITNEGKVKIMDFGLAKIGDGGLLTKVGSTLGTIAYISPEQAKGEEIDNRTDIWSFGVVLYEMLTGELPFRGDYDQAILYSVLNEEPKFLKKFDILPSIQRVIKKALKKDRDRRYRQISELITDLKLKEVSNAGSSYEGIIKDIKKLAVLPFSNLVNDPQTNFLGFALADQIIGSMAYSKNVLVRPSSTIRKYQDQDIDIQKAGSELNVNYVLAASYLKEADTIRLNIELVDLESETMIWREPIEIKYNNVFELQDIVSQKVVDELKVQFSEEERERMKPDTPQNPVAYEFYLRAVSYPYTIEGNKISIEMLNNSINLDPLYAPAYMELGSRYNQLSQVGTSTIVAQNKAEEALLKALSLKKDFLPALANLGFLYTDTGKHEEAHEMLIRALKINPNDAWLHFSLSYHYRYIGFLEESRKEAETALAIDHNNPRFRSSIITSMFLGKFDEILNTFNLDVGSPFTLNHLGEVAFRTGNYELANKYFQEVLSIKNEIGEFYLATSFIEFMKGNIEKAEEYNLKRELENPADSENFYEIARIYGLLNKTEACSRALRKSIDMGYVSYPSMQSDSFLDPVRPDPGIQDLLMQAKMRHEELKKKLLTTY
ncbi:MAG: protein kinase [Bacteroidetes bacterium]|nr:protein kinase [Bacteroidota bacterium]